MDHVTKDDLTTLIDRQGKWCVSIYMPTVRAGTETQQNPIRFRNLLREAEERLVDLGMRAPEAQEMLKPLDDLQNDIHFWRHQSDGLAVFLCEGEVRSFRVPVDFRERVVVNERLYIKPLLPLFSGDGRFYILAISQDQIRLLEGTRDSVAEVELTGVPESMAEALWPDDPERQLQFRTIRSQPRGGTGGTEGTVAFHGHGVGDELDKQDIKRYLQKVDRGLMDKLADERAPLLLAGVDYLLPIYREATKYQYLLDEGLTGNPDNLSARELHAQAWELVKPVFTKAQADAAARYHEHAGRDDGQASNDLKTVLRAAHEGRIDVLFVAVGAQEWGQFRTHSFNVHVHPEMQPGDQDLIDLAAVQTVVNGGTVYAVEQDEVPGGGPIAAVFRY